MIHAAVIFDVDGVLLELTPSEEDAFLKPFEHLYGLSGLSRDWDSYRVRNDEEIVSDILETHLGRAPEPDEVARHLQAYCAMLEAGYVSGELKVETVPGACGLIAKLAGTAGLALGTATANMLRAAELRLARAGLWQHLCDYACGADGGGHKREVLARAMARLGLPPDRVVYVGDNLNDLEAGRAAGAHFVGFATEAPRRDRLARAGATAVSGDHHTTLGLIDAALGVL